MKPYLKLMHHLLTQGDERGDRTGTGTQSTFGPQMRFDLNAGLPLVTTKALHLPSLIYELLWMLSGDTNIKYLQERKVRIWNEWADENGDLGPVYGEQWRHWQTSEGGYIDQIQALIDGLIQRPYSRRHIVSAWNVEDLPDEDKTPQQNVAEGRMALAPCHCFVQFYVRDLILYERKLWLKDNTGGILSTNSADEVFMGKVLDEVGVPRQALSCQLTQRSADIFLGVPFNIGTYALLTHMVAQQVNMAPDTLIWTGGDTHLYRNHVEAAKIQLARKPRALPKLKLNKAASIFDYTFEDFEIIGYNPAESIKVKVSV